MITTKNEKEFIDHLYRIQIAGKLIFGELVGNQIRPTHEIRLMPTVGGMQYSISEIDWLNRKGSGRYTTDVEEVYIRAIDIERTSRINQWYIVDNVEHTPEVYY